MREINRDRQEQERQEKETVFTVTLRGRDEGCRFSQFSDQKWEEVVREEKEKTTMIKI